MDVFDAPRYTSAIAARLVKLSSWRVRRWLMGYKYSYVTGVDRKIKERQSKPVITRRRDETTSYASFLELIDLLFVKRFLEYGVSLQRIRKALEEAEKLIGGWHFAREIFFTDGKKIYLQIKTKQKADALMELLSGGQWVIAPVIKQLATQIDFDDVTGIARRWYPLGHGEPIVIDPQISFGKPSIVDRGIATANVYDFYVAENKSVESASEWFGLRRREVEAAVHYENQLAAAA